MFGAPAVDGLGNAGGFKLMVEDLGDVGARRLAGAVRKPGRQGEQARRDRRACSAASAPTRRSSISTSTGRNARRMDVPLGDVFNTLQVYLGGYYVNDFNRFGRTWQVNLQADAPFRLKADDVASSRCATPPAKWSRWERVATVEDIGGPAMITRYNMRTAAALNGAALPGVSSGTVITTIDGIGRAGIAERHDASNGPS